MKKADDLPFSSPRTRNTKRRRRLLRIEPWCAYCGRMLTAADSTVDHVLARAWGGRNNPDNCWLACHGCNEFKQCDPVEVLACPVRRGGELRYVWQVSLSERCVMSTVSFNYEALEESLRESTEAHAQEIKRMVQRAAEDIVAIGKRLIEVRAAIGKTTFAAWLRAEFHWSQTTASNYMQAAAKFGKLDCLSFFQPSALCLLVRRNVHQGAVDEATRRAKKRVMITYVEAKRLIAKHADPADAPDRPLPVARARTFINALVGRIDQAERAALADELLQLSEAIRASIQKPAPQPSPAKSPRTPKPAGQPGKEVHPKAA